MLYPILFCALGFVALIKGADFLVTGASSLAKKLRVSEIVIGLTVVAFGTSMPELVVNIFGSIRGNSDIVLGNVIGSNILNILLILGIAGLIYPLNVLKNTVWREIPFALFAVIAFYFLAADDVPGMQGSGMISVGDGILLLSFFTLFVIYVFYVSKISSTDNNPVKQYSTLVTNLMILGGLGGLFIGGKLVVDNAVVIARILGMSDKMIAITIMAAGTSLPELVTSAVAAYKKRCDIAVGNIVGSGIFNILLVIGVSAVIRPISFTEQFNFDVFVMGFATIILFVTMFTGKKHRLDRWEAGVLLAAYVGYMMFLISKN